MNEVLLERFIQLIATRMGLHIRLSDRQAFSQKIALRMQVLKQSTPESYYHLLEAKTSQSNHEWQQLAQLLTTTESYFFRDQGQITLLRDRILPELIEGNKLTRSLRIWSAGCSTGEEPYSLAILLRELIPDWHNWNLLILGSDINEEALEKARRGVYSPWSFRLVNAQLQQQYFKPLNTGWKLDKKIRQMVTFQSKNLVQDSFPNWQENLYRMDLILCRNVFVYFEFKTISDVLKKFFNTLKPGGYILTGHTELQGQNLGQFHAKVSSKSVFYQRPKNLIKSLSSVRPVSINSPSPKATIPSSDSASILSSQASPSPPPKPRMDARGQEPFQTLFNEAVILFKKKAYAEAIQKALQVLQLHPPHFGAYSLIAHMYANLGQYDQAIHYSQQALSLNSLAPEPYYLLAKVAQEQGEIEKAKNFLKKIIYLVPDALKAYLELGFIYEQEGNLIKAKKMRNIALALLKKLPSSERVEHYEALTVKELQVQLEKLQQVST